MDDSYTWQDLLGKIISNPQERQRIAEVTGVRPITLIRWSTKKSTPRLDNLRTLLDAIPQHYEEMRKLLQEEYPELARELQEPEEIIAEVPSAFYSQILNTSTTSPPILRKTTICTLVLQQILRHLDPRQQGMEILLMLCVPPRDRQKVRSIRTSFGRGTPPWENHLDHRVRFVGAESQSGHAIRTGHPIVVQSQEERNWLYPTHLFDFEESVVTSPLLLSGQTAGCLYIASTQKHYFSQAHLDLIQAYVDLLIVAFEAEDFYHFQQIELELIPTYEVQQPYLAQFRQRVEQLMIQSTQEKKPVTRPQAELYVWQELEAELLYLALHPQPVDLSRKPGEVSFENSIG